MMWKVYSPWGGWVLLYIPVILFWLNSSRWLNLLTKLGNCAIWWLVNVNSACALYRRSTATFSDLPARPPSSVVLFAYCFRLSYGACTLFPGCWTGRKTPTLTFVHFFKIVIPLLWFVNEVVSIMFVAGQVAAAQLIVPAVAILHLEGVDFVGCWFMLLSLGRMGLLSWSNFSSSPFDINSGSPPCPSFSPCWGCRSSGSTKGSHQSVLLHNWRDSPNKWNNQVEINVPLFTWLLHSHPPSSDWLVWVYNEPEKSHRLHPHWASWGSSCIYPNDWKPHWALMKQL